MDFVRADTRNLPEIDTLMLIQFFKTEEFSLSEIKGWKMSKSMRSSYINAAVGYVRLKREGEICIVEGKICPEHNISKKNYTVLVKIQEKDEEIIEARCLDCAASQGGCKHAIAFVMWLHERSSDPSPTQTTCLWKKPQLSSVNNDKTATLENDFHAIPYVLVENSHSIVDRFIQNTSFPSNLLFVKTMYQASEFESLNLHIAGMTFTRNICNGDTSFLSYLEKTVTKSVCERACKATQKQSDSALWHTLRYGRITASTIYELSKAKSNKTIVQKILGASKIPVLKAMERGKHLEKFVLHALSKIIGIQFSSAGFLVKSDYPDIGASPDAISKEYVVEIKCPFKERTVKNFISPNGVLKPKLMAQIQLQMFVFGKKKGIVVIADPKFEENERIEFVYVNFDSKYMEDLIYNARESWCKCILPALLM